MQMYISDTGGKWAIQLRLHASRVRRSALRTQTAQTSSTRLDTPTTKSCLMCPLVLVDVASSRLARSPTSAEISLTT